jgi:signal peptide peptidase SppA
MQLNAVNLDNYGGLWCVEPVRFSQLLDRVNSMNLAAHVASQQPRVIGLSDQRFSVLEGGSIAIIDIQGTMTKAGSSLGGGGTVEARQAIRQAEKDPSISSILLRIDSPGGTVSGTADLAAEVAKTTKPTVAFVEDLCCSAAMWVASQADEIFANNATAMIGSIGTFMGLYDVSKALENEGIRAVVVKAGEFKGGGFPGMEITDAQIAEWQKQIDAIQAEFTSGISTGRKLSIDQAQKLVTGLTYTAAEAQSLKLIDGIKTFDEVVAGLRSRVPQKGPATMSETTAAPKAATYREIVAACPGIDPKCADDAQFITECLSDEMTVSDANELYCETLISRLKAAQATVESQAAEIVELKAAASSKLKGAPSVGTAPKSATGSSDARTAFNAAVKAEQDRGLSRSAAVIAVNKRQPELRSAMLEEAAATN